MTIWPCSVPRPSHYLSSNSQGSLPDQISLGQPLGLAVGQSPLTDHNLISQRLSTLASNKLHQTLKAEEVWQSMENLRLSTLPSKHMRQVVFAKVLVQT